VTRRQRHFRVRRRSRPGAPPGTLIADPQAHGSAIHMIAYGPDAIDEREGCTAADIRAARARAPVVWINVDGLADIALIEELGNIFGLHGLALEDVVNVHQRPKAEEYDDHVFVVLRMITGSDGAETEQLSLFLGAGFVLTFQERPGDCLDPVRERLRRGKGQVRGAGADYLAYTLIDAVIDAYFPVLEGHGEVLEDLEDEVVARPRAELVAELHAMKRSLLTLRRAIWPQREMVNALVREESPFISHQTSYYLRDCYDHTIQLLDLVETYREIATGLVDVYLSSMSARLNEIMKVLTVIATIFMPLGFIAGVYGMNFDRASPWNMPELGWRFGYPFALAVMLAAAVGLIIFFRRRGWLGGRDDPPKA